MDFKECFIITISAGRVQELKDIWEASKMKLSNPTSLEHMKTLIDQEKAARETYFSAAMKFDVQRINAESRKRKVTSSGELRTLQSFQATQTQKVRGVYERV